MDENTGNDRCEREPYDTKGDPQAEQMMKKHEQDVAEFLEQYDDPGDGFGADEIKLSRRDERLTGLGGWLVFLLILMSLGIFFGFIYTALLLIQPSLIESTFYFIVDIFILLLNVFLLVVLVKKLWFFPGLYQIVMGTSIVYRALLMIFYVLDTASIVLIILYSLWILYFQMSVRVKNTFIYCWSGETNANSAASANDCLKNGAEQASNTS